MAIADLREGSDANTNLEKTTMIVAMVPLVELVEQGADADQVREMLAFAAERMMDLEIDATTGAAGTRSPDRLNDRNGYRDRNWDTRRVPVARAVRSGLAHQQAG